MNIFDIMRNATAQAGAQMTQPQGAPPTAPAYSRTDFQPTGQSPIAGMGADPFQMIMQQRKEQFQNLRSPTVRRTAGGDIVDEAAPKGIDWLRDNGGRGQKHSWEQDTSRWAPSNRSPFPRAEQPQVQKSESGVRAMMGPYGGGFSTGVDKAHGTPFQAPPVYNEGMEPSKPDVMLPNEQQNLQSAVQQAYNETLVNPRMSVGEREAQRRMDGIWNQVREGVPMQLPPEQPAAQPQQQPQPQVPEAIPYNTEGPPVLGLQNLNSPLMGGQTYFEDPWGSAQVRGSEAVTSGSPGLLPLAGRTVGMTGASVWDLLRNVLWDRSAGPDTVNAFSNWINPPQPAQAKPNR